jgi:rod shape-determining protein MreC
MEHIVSRFRNLTILGVVLFAQIIGLAVQVNRPSQNGGSARLIRIWTSAAITPLERAVVGMQQGLSYAWRNYFDLRGVRVENEGLKLQLDQLRIQQVRLREDAAQAHRLQALFRFKEQFVSQTIAAQVIGTGASEHSRVIYIDKGTEDGLRTDMAVITPEGIVGKIIRADKTTSQVLLINDEQGGVGAILEKSRLQGIVGGTPSGALILHNVMNDEKVDVGEPVVASGGDGVFPKGMPIGRVKNIRNGPDVFFEIELAPAADLNRLEEVLVVTKLAYKSPDLETVGPIRAADMLAERLPSVPPPPPTGQDGKPLTAAPAANGAGAASHRLGVGGASTSPSASAANSKPNAAASANVIKPAPKPAGSTVNPAQQPGGLTATTGQAITGTAAKPTVKPATQSPQTTPSSTQPGITQPAAQPASPQPKKPDVNPSTDTPPRPLR